jgi:hypothetical protein
VIDSITHTVTRIIFPYSKLYEQRIRASIRQVSFKAITDLALVMDVSISHLTALS